MNHFFKACITTLENTTVIDTRAMASLPRDYQEHQRRSIKERMALDLARKVISLLSFDETNNEDKVLGRERVVVRLKLISDEPLSGFNEDHAQRVWITFQKPDPPPKASE